MASTLENRALEYAFIRHMDRIFEKLCADIELEKLNAVRSPTKSTATLQFSKAYHTARDAYAEALNVVKA